MKKDNSLVNFVEGVEMTVLPQEDQILLSSGAWGFSGMNIGDCKTVNNCNGGNCVTGCGSK